MFPPINKKRKPLNWRFSSSGHNAGLGYSPCPPRNSGLKYGVLVPVTFWYLELSTYIENKIGKGTRLYWTNDIRVRCPVWHLINSARALKTKRGLWPWNRKLDWLFRPISRQALGYDQSNFPFRAWPCSSSGDWVRTQLPTVASPLLPVLI